MTGQRVVRHTLLFALRPVNGPKAKNSQGRLGAQLGYWKETCPAPLTPNSRSYITHFPQPDSIIPDQYNSLDWDRYAYARNNPVQNTDSSGHCIDGLTTIPCLMGLIAIAGGAGGAAIYQWNDIGHSWWESPEYAAGTAQAAVEGAFAAEGAALLVGSATAAAAPVIATGLCADGDCTNEVLPLTGATETLPDEALVCRGGLCTADRFLGGTGVTVDNMGRLSGVSVNSSPASVPIQELASTIPNNQVGVTSVGNVRALGGNAVFTPTLRNPYHSDLSGLTAEQLEKLFTPVIRNPWLYPQPK